jgi:hypothetical protein
MSSSSSARPSRNSSRASDRFRKPQTDRIPTANNVANFSSTSAFYELPAEDGTGQNPAQFLPDVPQRPSWLSPTATIDPEAVNFAPQLPTLKASLPDANVIKSTPSRDQWRCVLTYSTEPVQAAHTIPLVTSDETLIECYHAIGGWFSLSSRLIYIPCELPSPAPLSVY